MEIVILRIIYWLIFAVGSLAIIAGLFYLSFKLLTYILKATKTWYETLRALSIYFALKRNENWIIFNKKFYTIEEKKK